MLSKEERMEKLNNAGIDNGKYFTLNLPEGLPKGAKITLSINENGEPMFVNENNQILNQIIEDGYVRNTRLHRRFVMAQMFQMLNFQSWKRSQNGYNDYLKIKYAYHYTFTMMLEEVRVLSKLEVRDYDTFKERVHFFDKEVIIEIMKDYIEKLKKYVNDLPNHKCKGVPYKKIKGTNIFTTDLDKKLYSPLVNKVKVIKHAKNYTEIYKVLNSFMKIMIKLPYETPKSKAWIDAYKGAGAFYTMKNLLAFHGCFIETENGIKLYGVKAVKFIETKLDEYKGEGWRMFALMKKVIADNGFDFDKRMDEIYSK